MPISAVLACSLFVKYKLLFGTSYQNAPLCMLAIKDDSFVSNSVLLSSDPHFCPCILCGSSGGWLQQTQKSLPQPDACRRCDTDGPLPPFQDRRSGKYRSWHPEYLMRLQQFLLSKEIRIIHSRTRFHCRQTLFDMAVVMKVES